MFTKNLLIILIVPLFILSWSQGCSKVSFLKSASILPTAALFSGGAATESGNGGTYDGKLRVLHHYVDNFTCEGKPQPESILIRKNAMDWVIIRNENKACAVVDQAPVTGVVYDDVLKVATFENKTYVAPVPYYVDANEDPNLPDIKPIDGVCEDINGKCSLLAALDTAGVASYTSNVIVNVAAGIYKINKYMDLNTGPNNTEVSVVGTDATTTILDGGWTFNFRFPGDLEVRRTKFINNKPQSSAVYSMALNTLISEVMMIGNTSGIYIDNSSISNTSAVIENSSITGSENTGIGLMNCLNCRIENTTIAENKSTGIWFANNNKIKPSLIISNSTIFNNDISPTSTDHGNFWIYLESDGMNLILNNSIVANDDLTRKNCDLSGSSVLSGIIANNSIMSDASCKVQGGGNLIMNPKLGPVSNNGGRTLTLLPLLGSPAIDAGENAVCLPLDQRGLPRPVDKLYTGPKCDIGAVELQ
jgi:hypothetical protein